MYTGLIIAPGLQTYLAAELITRVQPTYIAFIVDDVTTNLVENILQEARHEPVAHKIFFIKQEVSTRETMQEFFRAYHWLVDTQHVSTINIDATNTLKPRAIALYMTGSFLEVFKHLTHEEVAIKLVYTRSDFAPDGGVVRGSERIIELDEPVDSLSYSLAFYAITLFNTYAYHAAKKTFQILESKTTDQQYLLYSGLRRLSYAYDQWDKMRLTEAAQETVEASALLRKLPDSHFARNLVAHLMDVPSILETTRANFGLHQIVDIYQNGNRRVEEHRFDDALARFYCCLEMIGRYRLLQHGVETSKPDYELLPLEILRKFRAHQHDVLPVELDLKKSFDLLYCLEDPVAGILKRDRKTFVGLLGMRNLSILAHGTTPVTKQNVLLFLEKLVAPMLTDLFSAEKVNAETLLAQHSHLKLPASIRHLF